MRALGIPAVRPVACGSRRIGHFVAACFLITEEVPDGCNLTTLAHRLGPAHRPPSPELRRDLARRLARQVARMHAAGFAHGALFWRNIVARPGPDGAYEFFFLDAEPPRLWHRLGNDEWWRAELAQLAVSAEPFTTRSERLRFLLAYADAARLNPELKACARAIDRLSARWRQHEIRRVKMNELFELWNQQLSVETGRADDLRQVPRAMRWRTQP